MRGALTACVQLFDEFIERVSILFLERSAGSQEFGFLFVVGCIGCIGIGAPSAGPRTLSLGLHGELLGQGPAVEQCEILVGNFCMVLL